jgi:hypothetical protein
VDLIDAYIAALNGALRGPARARADLLSEARDSLIDATEAYERRGLPRAAAERQAVREFGDVHAIAPEYQTELGLVQSRRTALLCLCLLLLQPLVWNSPWLAAASDMTGDLPAPYALLSELVEWVGGAAMIGALSTALATGTGVRHLRAPQRLAGVTGVFAVTVATALGAMGLLLALFHPQPGLLPSWPLLTVALPLPMLFVALSGQRCLRTREARS